MFVLTLLVLFQTEQANGTKPTVPAKMVAATVNGAPIYVREVDKAVETTLSRQAIQDEAVPALRAAALARLIDRRLADQVLLAKEGAATTSEVDTAIDAIKAQLKQQKVSFQDYLASKQMAEPELRDKLQAELNRKRLVAEITSDEKLAAYFKEHAADFDGREIRARHVLLRLPKNASPSDQAEAIAEAKRILTEIRGGKLSFADAAKKYSARMTASESGALGFIPRHGEMPEAFSRSAFALKLGEISEPVVSPFGVHLIQYIEVKAAERDVRWTDVQEQLRSAIIEEHFLAMADAVRKTAKVQFEPGVPHFKLGTRELVAQ